MKGIKNCKIIYGEHVSIQHKVVVMDWQFRAAKKRGLERGALRIKWWRLKDEHLKKEFKDRMVEFEQSRDKKSWKVDSIINIG